MTQPSAITRLLDAASGGDRSAAEELLPLVYGELRAVAESRMRKIPPGQTLQPTALVHEAYMRVLGNRAEEEEGGFENRSHFFFAAARAMRDILVEQARAKAALKRGGDRKKVSADNLSLAIEAPADDMLALGEALERFEAAYPRKHRLVMLRFFAGLTEAEAAEALGVTERTARRDWQFARAYLHGELTPGDTGADV